MTTRSVYIFVWILALGLCLVAESLLTQGIRLTQILPIERMHPFGGHAYVVQLEPIRKYLAASSDSKDGAARSTGLLREDGIALGPAHAIHDVIRQQGGGSFSHWNDAVVFSALDGSDPRQNGRTYSFETSYTLVEPYRTWAELFTRSVVVLLAIAAAIAFRSLFWRIARLVWTEISPSLRFSAKCAWPFVPIAIILSLTVAPLTNIDSQLFALFPLKNVLPLYPPLYPSFVHALSAVAELIAWPFGGGAPQSSLSDPAPFTALAAKTVLFAQHGLNLFASAYLASRFRSDLLGARLITGLLYLNPETLLLTHGVFTEAITTPFVYGAIAQAVSILSGRATRIWQYGVFFVWTVLAGLSRHPAIVVGALLSFGMAYASVRAAIQKKAGCLKRFALRSLVTMVAALGCYGIVLLVTNLAMISVGLEVRPAVGRQFTMRFSFRIVERDERFKAGGWVLMMPGYDRPTLQATVDRLIAMAPEELKSSILLATTGEPWVEPYLAIYKEILEHCPGCSEGHVAAETDRRLNEVMLFAILHPDADFMRDILLRVAEYTIPFVVHRGDSVGYFYPAPKRRDFDQSEISAGFRWEGTELERITKRIIGFIRMVAFAAALATLVTACFFRRRITNEAVAGGLLLTILVYAATVSLVTIYVGRYGVFVDQLAIVAIIALLARARKIPPPRQRLGKSQRQQPGQNAALCHPG